MFLSHSTIERYIEEGKIVIQPEFYKSGIRPVGVRLHLAKDLLVPEPGQTVDLTSDDQHLKYREVDLAKEEFILEPSQFILGATYESIQTPPNILAILDGRSTLARLGLTVHLSACAAHGTVVSPHAVVLEMKNVGNFRIKLKFKDPVAMMLFAEMTEPVIQNGQSQYYNQHKVTPPIMGARY